MVAQYLVPQHFLNKRIVDNLYGNLCIVNTSKFAGMMILPQWLKDILKKKENNNKLLEKEKPTNVKPDKLFELFDAPENYEKTKELEVCIKNMD